MVVWPISHARKEVGLHIVGKTASNSTDGSRLQPLKEIFGSRMLDNVRKYGLMPEENYSERGKVPDDGTLAKVIFNNVPC